MPFEIKDRGIRKFKGIAPLTGLQNPVTTVANRRAINRRAGVDEFLVESAVQDSRIGLTPRIDAVYWHDVSAQVWHNLLDDGNSPPAILDSAQTGVSEFTLDSDDFLYIGAVDVIAGVRIDLDGTLINNNAATLTGEYSSGGGFTASAITDGLATAGATFGTGTPGNITFDTVPVAGVWHQIDLVKSQPTFPGTSLGKLYWMRLVASALLDQVEIEQMAALLEVVHDDTGLADAFHLDDLREYTVPLHESVGGIEFWTQGTDSTINLSWLIR